MRTRLTQQRAHVFCLVECEQQPRRDRSASAGGLLLGDVDQRLVDVRDVRTAALRDVVLAASGAAEPGDIASPVIAGSSAIGVAADGSLAWQRTYEGPTAFGSDTANEAAVAPDGSTSSRSSA